jgi:MSHA pilin protein MshA
MQQMKQKGFTLIELIVVMVILGILAAIAMPKFVDLTREARTAVVQSTAGSLQSAAALVYAKAVTTGQMGTAQANGQVCLGAAGTNSGGIATCNGTGVFINVAHGFPASMQDLLNATSGIAAADARGQVNMDDAESKWTINRNLNQNNLQFRGAPTPANCAINIVNMPLSGAGQTMSFNPVTTGC